MDASETFPFAFDRRYAWLVRGLGVKPHNAEVTVGGGNLAVRFGRWHLSTPIGNIACYEVTGNYRWFKAIGIRGSLADHGLTFGTNADRGLCVKFVEPIRSLLPMSPVKHPGMTVTVADIEGLAAALRRHGVTPDGE
jgi:hypothetical protein